MKVAAIVAAAGKGDVEPPVSGQSAEQGGQPVM